MTVFTTTNSLRKPQTFAKVKVKAECGARVAVSNSAVVIATIPSSGNCSQATQYLIEDISWYIHIDVSVNFSMAPMSVLASILLAALENGLQRR